MPSIVGFGAVLDNLSGLADNLPLAATIAGVTAAWLVVWSFLSGGVIDRFARGRRTRSHGFFAACGIHFWRFLRLGVVAWLVYAFLFAYVHVWIFTGVVQALTSDVTVERTAFAYRAGGYLIFGTLLVLCTLVFDYARVRIVVEDRRSAIGALLAGGRFVARHAGAAVGLYALNAVAFLVLVAIYAAIAPGAAGSGFSMWLVLGLGEVVHPRAALPEAAVLRVGNGILPGGAGARRVHCGAVGCMAGLPGRGNNRECGPRGGVLTPAYLIHGPPDFQERAHPDRRRRAGQRRPAASPARARRLQPHREHERFARSGGRCTSSSGRI